VVIESFREKHRLVAVFACDEAAHPPPPWPKA
jgi:hypothetical protein